ncbi:hypothetical protein BGX28_010427 [Mortierella sp. GBA30]|nr:hypothetical protein BGX28_010427 [Mortierella sp. GBA30]
MDSIQRHNHQDRQHQPDNAGPVSANVNMTATSHPTVQSDATANMTTIPLATTDASGYPDKHDGLAAHNKLSVIQDPREHHKHRQVQDAPAGHERSLLGRSIVEIREQLKDPELPMEMGVPKLSSKR